MLDIHATTISKAVALKHVLYISFEISWIFSTSVSSTSMVLERFAALLSS